MTNFSARVLLLATIASAAASSPAPRQPTAAPHASTDAPALVNTCLITRDVKPLAAFYASVLGIAPDWSGEDYVEFRTGVGVLAIFSGAAQQKYIPGAAEAASNRSVILEFRVEDVEQEYARLRSLVKTWVKPPGTQPWGTRSTYFRDPDGNLVDFYSAAKPQ